MSAMGNTNPVAAAAVSAALHAANTSAKQGAARPSSKPNNSKRADDELILAPSEVEGRDAVKALADNSQEQAHEDHQQHEGEQAKPRTPLDLEA